LPSLTSQDLTEASAGRVQASVKLESEVTALHRKLLQLGLSIPDFDSAKPGTLLNGPIKARWSPNFVSVTPMLFSGDPDLVAGYPSSKVGKPEDRGMATTRADIKKSRAPFMQQFKDQEHIEPSMRNKLTPQLTIWAGFEIPFGAIPPQTPSL
jgi:hypothetical protein